MSDTRRDRKWWISRAWDLAGVAVFFYLCGWLVADLLGDGEALSDGESVFWLVIVLAMAFAMGVATHRWHVGRKAPAQPTIDAEMLMAQVDQVKTANAAVVGVGNDMRESLLAAGWSPTAAEQIALMAMARAYTGGSS